VTPEAFSTTAACELTLGILGDDFLTTVHGRRHRLFRGEPERFADLLGSADFCGLLVAPVAALAAEFTRLVGQPVACNAFVSSAAVPGLPPHRDATDVFVYQLAGRKRWTLYARTGWALYTHTTGWDAPGPAPEPLDTAVAPDAAAIDEFVLTPGDVLYLPRGFGHQVVPCGDSTSVHLQFGAAA
jgi:ribosomal protein L16 Arg81 hydroxylase